MATRDINLLPADVKTKRKEEQVKTSLGNIFLTLLVVAAVVSFLSSALLIQTNLSQNKIKEDILRSQAKIKDLGIIESEAQRLDSKISALSTIIENRKRSSVLLEAIGTSIPQEITVVSLASLGGGKLSVSGSSLSYQSLSHFITSLLDPGLGGRVFVGADLTSASLDEVTGKIRFSLTLYSKEESLK